MSSRRAVIAGGSIGGLFVALILQKAGWKVQVLERVPVELSGRGAGIVTHDLLIQLIAAAGAPIADLGVPTEYRVAHDIDGAEVARHHMPQIVTSWDRVHSILRARMPEGSYVLGRNVTGYHDTGSGVEVLVSDGTRIEADLLVGADGFRSVVRARMLPTVQPEWSGYVVWRALAAEADLPERVRRELFPHFGFYLPDGQQVISYPIAGLGNDLRSGHRRFNFVWYAPVEPGRLPDMLTDASGQLHELSIPPPLIRDAIIEDMRNRAESTLSRPYREVLRVADRPFFTPIYDHLSPVMASGHVALAGDAACVARPHVGMGVTKAAGDAEALARHLQSRSVPEALAAYSAERQPAARIAWETARRLGGYVFGAAGRTDGRAHPWETELIAETAVVPAAMRDSLTTA